MTSSRLLADTSLSMVSGHTHCLPTIRQSSECFHGERSHSPSKCYWKQEIRHAGHRVFPQFEMHISCRGCQESESVCSGCYYSENTLSYTPLKREESCDSDGYEIWTAAEQRREFNAACSCTPTIFL
jgi:hypothetical protein